MTGLLIAALVLLLVPESPREFTPEITEAERQGAGENAMWQMMGCL